MRLAYLFVAATLSVVSALPGRVVAKDAQSKEAAAVAAQVKAAIEQRFPDVKIEDVHPASLLPGWYEVVTATDVAYSDGKADLLLVGKLLDTRTHEDLTARRWSELHAVDFGKLPLDLAIKNVKGDGSRKIAVFADPQCPYCRQLELNLKDLDNVTIYTFLYPLDELHPGATVKAHEIWCSDDRAAAWSQWMLEQKTSNASAASCTSDPTGTLRAVGAKLNINSTPTLFYADGSRVSGVVSRDDLESALARIALTARR